MIPVLVSSFFLGCQGEEKVVREEVDRLNIMQRFLGAIIPLAEKTWFVTLAGPETEIDDLKEPFDNFVRSIRFDLPDRPTWKLPEGWIEEDKKPDRFRYKTIRVPSKEKDKGLELTVSPLEGEKAASLPDNVNRWRMQMGLRPREPVELEDFYKKEKVGGIEVTLVDMLGPNPRKAPARQEEGPDYKVPEEWKEADLVEFSWRTYKVTEGNKVAVLTISRFPKDGGGLLLNVNRWLDKVNLPRVDKTQLLNILQDFPMADGKAHLVDLTGGPQAPPEANRILGAILPRDNVTWFFKMTGPSELVGKQKKNFETFLQSVQFGG